MKARAPAAPTVGSAIVRHQDSQRGGLVDGRGVGEDQDLAGRLLDGAVLSHRLSIAAAQRDELHARAEGADDLLRPVRRAVRDDDHLEPVGRIVERERVLELGADGGFLVVRRDDEGNGREVRLLPHRPVTDAADCADDAG